MFSVVIVLIAGFMTLYVIQQTERDVMPLSSKVSERMTRLWDVAQAALKENKFLRAEKALLTILKLDQKNAAAYNRLGILYSRQKEYKDAIECFEIASSIEPSASSLHNLGLIYYETENYLKAESAFESALKLEDGLAARHIAYAKVQEALGHDEKLIKALEKAVELEPNQQTYRLLANGYEHVGNDEMAQKTRKKLDKVIAPKASSTRVKRPRRVIY